MALTAFRTRNYNVNTKNMLRKIKSTYEHKFFNNVLIKYKSEIEYP